MGRIVRAFTLRHLLDEEHNTSVDHFDDLPPLEAGSITDDYAFMYNLEPLVLPVMVHAPTAAP